MEFQTPVSSQRVLFTALPLTKPGSHPKALASLQHSQMKIVLTFDIFQDQKAILANCWLFAGLKQYLLLFPSQTSKSSTTWLHILSTQPICLPPYSHTCTCLLGIYICMSQRHLKLFIISSPKTLLIYTHRQYIMLLLVKCLPKTGLPHSEKNYL